MLMDAATHQFTPHRPPPFVNEVESLLRKKEQSVWITTVETHNGEPCDCLPTEKEYKVGDKMTLTHTCVDGRVDVLEATVVRFSTPTHHGSVT